MAWLFLIVMTLARYPSEAIPPGEPLTVCAAISLTESLEAAAAAYRESGGGPVRFNFAGSNTLARQLVNGAPADLFISADNAQMDVAAAAGAIDRSTRVDLVENRLVVMVRPDTPPSATSGICWTLRFAASRSATPALSRPGSTRASTSKPPGCGRRCSPGSCPRATSAPP